MDDHPSTYESRPRRSLNQWLESEPLYDWLLAAYQNTRRSARQIEPFIREHNIDMREFKPVIYRSFAEFFDREFRPGVRTFVAAPDGWPLSPKHDISAGGDWRPTSSFPSRDTPSAPSKFSAMQDVRPHLLAAP